MANVIVKAMYGIVNVYSLLFGTAMTWNEIAVERYPKLTGFFTGVILGTILLK